MANLFDTNWREIGEEELRRTKKKTTPDPNNLQVQNPQEFSSPFSVPGLSQPSNPQNNIMPVDAQKRLGDVEYQSVWGTRGGGDDLNNAQDTSYRTGKPIKQVIEENPQFHWLKDSISNWLAANPDKVATAPGGQIQGDQSILQRTAGAIAPFAAAAGSVFLGPVAGTAIGTGLSGIEGGFNEMSDDFTTNLFASYGADYLNKQGLFGGNLQAGRFPALNTTIGGEPPPDAMIDDGVFKDPTDVKNRLETVATDTKNKNALDLFKAGEWTKGIQELMKNPVGAATVAGIIGKVFNGGSGPEVQPLDTGGLNITQEYIKRLQPSFYGMSPEEKQYIYDNAITKIRSALGAKNVLGGGVEVEATKDLIKSIELEDKRLQRDYAAKAYNNFINYLSGKETVALQNYAQDVANFNSERQTFNKTIADLIQLSAGGSSNNTYKSIITKGEGGELLVSVVPG